MSATIPRLVRLLLTALVAAGCVVSTEAVITDADATFDERLLGTWAEASGSDGAVVTRGQGNAYAIEYRTRGATGRFEARLGRLGDRLVLDVRPTPQGREMPAPYWATLVPAHLVVALDIGADEIRIALLETDSLRAELDAGRVRMPAAREPDRVVLRGTTAELRAALAAHVARPGALAMSGVFRRTR